MTNILNHPMLLFISDIHLSNDEPSQKLAQAVLKYIDECRQQSAPAPLQVYLLGDILNVYWGEGTPLAQPFFWQALKNMDIQCFLMAGNRDFLITQKVLQEFNISLIADPTILYVKVPHLNPRRPLKIMLSHGDQWVSGDFAYQIFRYITRAKITQLIFSKLPQSWRSKLANYLRQKSQGAKNTKKYPKKTFSSMSSIPSIYSQINMDYLKKMDADVIIHGHTHRPKHAIYHRQNSTHPQKKPLYYFVTSDWCARSAYAVIIDEDIKLHQFI